VGLLADRLPRPKLLAAGLASWSGLTLLASGAQNFGELIAARVGFAAAQAVQNPISFALSEWQWAGWLGHW
jgi:MFS family permease